jgi:hypothetical protein
MAVKKVASRVADLADCLDNLSVASKVVLMVEPKVVCSAVYLVDQMADV